MTIKKWHWALVTIGILIVLLILLTGTGERTVSNIFFIPAGTFSPVPYGNASPEGDLQPQDQKKIATDYYIYEGDPGYQQILRSDRNITILHVTDDDLKKFPKLESTLHSDMNTTAAGDTKNLREVARLKGDISDYPPFINSVCKNRTRQECYADMAAFEYNGRYYFISVVVLDIAEPPGGS